MSRIRIVLILAALFGALLAPQSGADEQETRSETKPYNPGTDALMTDCELGLGTDLGVGGACFGLDGNEESVDLVVEDLTGLDVGVIYFFLNGAGASVGGLGQFCGSGDGIPIPFGAASITVYPTGPVFGAINCLSNGSPGIATVGTITATFHLTDDTTPPALDEERECLEAVPAAAGVQGITDDGSDVSLDVRVLLDGVDQTLAEAVFAAAAKSYEPLGITMNVTGYEAVEFTGVDAAGLNSQAKERFSGARPAGSDVVYTLTNKDIEALGQNAVAGLADCLGGVRFPERAFAVGEVITFEDTQIGPFTFYHEATARTVAHEIGHLMGGQHHLANCIEGVPGDVTNGEATPCTLMFNSLDTGSGNFGTLNGAIVRGHAFEHAH